MLMLVLASCHKDEKIAPEYMGTGNSNDPFALRHSQVSIGDDYRYQVYFDLGTNSVVGTGLKSRWDLALSCDDQFVYLNSAKNEMRAALSPLNWDETISAEGLEYEWDAPTRHADSLAIGDNHAGVFVINRGDDHEGEELGFKKLVISRFDDYWWVRVAELDGTMEYEMEIPVDSDYNFMFLNLDGTLQEVEPPKDSWDVYFSSYLYVFDPDTEPFPYLVNGCLLSDNEVQAAEVFDKSFEEIGTSDLESQQFSSFTDAIGYDWKYFDFDLGYVTDPSMNFIVRSTEGSYYKLHFTSFVDSEGVKGNPTFEFQLIQE